MRRIRFFLALWTAKACVLACRLIGRKGSSAPGFLALKVYPGVLEELARRTPGKAVAVCGTNGKTTTNNLLYTILTAKGMRVVCNRLGSNMISGVTAAYLDACDGLGRVRADVACVEVDEASSVRILDCIKPDYLVITNLFRDQLDRYGEIDITMDLLKKALAKTPDTVLVLNGDDPLCASFCQTLGRKSVFFGIDEDAHVALQETKEGRFCVFCHHELSYHYYHYSQLGDYYCENCGFHRPALDFPARQIELGDHLGFVVGDIPIRAPYRGFYNIYNILAAYSVASLLGVGLGDINQILASYKPQIGRMEEFTVDGVPTILNLSKNPAGFNQAISTMMKDPRNKDVVVVINDNDQDGTDISWIWDVDFERMAQGGFSRFAASGIRAEDVAVRMKYAEVPSGSVTFEKDIEAAIKALVKNDNDVLYVLVNYTPLFETERILLKLQKEGT